MTPDFQSSIILITSVDKNNKNFGTGFIIHKDDQATYLLTCSHVIKDIGGADQIIVGKHKAVLVASGNEEDVIDLAILRVNANLLNPVIKLQNSGQVNTSFVAAGFQLFDQHFLIRPIRGKFGEKVGLESKAQLGRIDAWDLNIEDGYSLQRGYSGSPVIDEKSGNALAVLSHRIADGRKGVAISIKSIQTIWEDMPPEILPKVGKKNQPVASFNTPTILQSRAPIFVRRDKQLNLLSSNLSNVLNGRGKTGFILGEAGSGKSTLAIEFARQTINQHSEFIFCVGNVNMISGFGNSYGPFKSILEQLLLSQKTTIDNNDEMISPLDICAKTLMDFGIRDLGPFCSFSGVATDALHKIIYSADVKEVVNANTLASFDQNILLDWYSKIIRNISNYFPLLLIVEDLQWADDSSLYMFMNLSRLLEFHPIFLIGTYRQEEATNNKLLLEIRDQLGGKGAFSINLEAKSRQKSISQNENYLFCKDYLFEKYGTVFSEEFILLLLRLTNGNALFVSELLINLEEQNFIIFSNGEWKLESPVASFEQIPSKIEHIMSQRIGRLDEVISKTLKFASVEGEVFTGEVISRLQDVDPNIFMRMTINQLVRIHQLIREIETKQLPDNTRLHMFSFNHILTQRYIYEYLLTGIEREMFHELVANELEDLWGESAPEIAAQLTTHFSLAKIPDKTIQYSLFAAKVFANQFGWSEVAQFARLGIKLWDGNPKMLNRFDISVIVELRLLYAKSEFEGGIYREEIDHVQAGIDALKACLPYLPKVEPSLAAEVYLTLGKLVATKQVVSQYYGNEYLEKALKIYEEIGNNEGIVSALSIYSFDTNLSDQSAADEQLFIRLRCLELVKELDNPVLLSKSLSDLAIHYFNFDTDIDEPLKIAEEHALKSLEISSQINNPIAEMYSILVLSWVYHHCGYYGEKLETLRLNLLDLSRKHGQIAFEADALTDVGHYYSFLVGTHSKAEKIIEEAYEFRSRMGRHTVHDCDNYAGYLFRVGKFKKCISMLEKAAKQQDDDRATRTRSQIIRILAMTGKTNEALNLLQDLKAFISRNPSVGISANSPLMFSYNLLGDENSVILEVEKIEKAIPSAVKRGLFHTYYDYPTELAEIYLLLNNQEKAIYWIGIAHQNWNFLARNTSLENLVRFWEHEYIRAKILFEQGNYQDAKQILERVNQIFKDIRHYALPEVLLYLGQLNYQKFDSQKAKAYYVDAMKKAETYPLPNIMNQATKLLDVINNGSI